MSRSFNFYRCSKSLSGPSSSSFAKSWISAKNLDFRVIFHGFHRGRPQAVGIAKKWDFRHLWKPAFLHEIPIFCMKSRFFAKPDGKKPGFQGAHSGRPPKSRFFVCGQLKSRIFAEILLFCKLVEEASECCFAANSFYCLQPHPI